jgi:hypothetical protein
MLITLPTPGPKLTLFEASVTWKRFPSIDPSLNEISGIYTLFTKLSTKSKYVFFASCNVEKATEALPPGLKA